MYQVVAYFFSYLLYQIVFFSVIYFSFIFLFSYSLQCKQGMFVPVVLIYTLTYYYLNRKSLGNQCLFGTCGLHAWACCHNCGRYWQHQDEAASCTEENSRGPWLTMWFLYPRDCHVNVHITEKLAQTYNEGYGSSIPR